MGAFRGGQMPRASGAELGLQGEWEGGAGGAPPTPSTRFLRAALFPGSAEHVRCDHKLEITQTVSASATSHFADLLT